MTVNQQPENGHSQTVQHEEQATALKLTKDCLSLSALEIKTDFGVAAVPTLITGMFVGKCPKTSFTRTLPNLALTFATVWRKQANEMDEQFLIIPDALKRFCPPDLLTVTQFIPWITREDVLGAWPMKQPQPGRVASAWYTSAEEFIRAAENQWCRLESGNGRYNISPATGITKEPAWPEGFDKEQFFEIALAKHVAESSEDPTLRALRGDE